MSISLRSPRHQTGGIFIFARVIDKIRLAADGALPDGYTVGLVAGNRTFDDRLCAFLGVDFEALRARTLEGGSDGEILEWCFQNGSRPDAERIEVWNGFISKRGWRDSGAEGLEKARAGAGFGDREDIQTWFDLIDAEETGG